MKRINLRLLGGFIIALCLSIIPMPEIITGFRPPWILLLSLYLDYFLPNKFYIIILLVVGLLLDVLMATILGQHVLALLLTAWVATKKSRRFQFFSMIQQIFLIGFFCLLYQAIIVFTNAALGFNYLIYTPFMCCLSGIFFWPWFRLMADNLFVMPLEYRLS